MTSALISAAELKTILQQPHVKVFDASYNQPPSAAGIPGARDFDIDDIADHQAPFAHTVPSPETFAEKISAFGVSNDNLVIVYDRAGIAMAASRVWWMFRLFGHDNVRVLNGGLPAWVKAGYETANKTTAAPAPTSFKVDFRPELLKKVDQITNNLLRKDFTVLDARDMKRFEAGHIPNSHSVPYAELVNAEGMLKTAPVLERIFQDSFADLQKKLTCSCGSGVTACVIALALYELGHKNAAIYDGSWTEWGASSILPKAQGADLP